MKKNANKKVIIGGTFEVLHKGHLAFLKKAFSLGKVTIGLTSDKMAGRLKKRKVKSFEQRKKELKNFAKKKFNSDCRIVRIEDIFGPVLRQNFDYLVVSPETYDNALLINKKRTENKKKLIEIVEIKLVLAEDKKPISSTRILKGLIDKNGRLLKTGYKAKKKSAKIKKEK